MAFYNVSPVPAFASDHSRYQRQREYYARLRRLDARSQRLYWAVFERIARLRALDDDVAQRAALAQDTPAVSLVRELMAVVEEALHARERGDDQVFQDMTQLLEDMSVAAHAVMHRQCLQHARQALSGYRALQTLARRVSLN